jgi:hypothetical protein
VTVSIEPNELEPLRSAMRDIQMAAARYYEATLAGGDLGDFTRIFVSASQKVNELLTRKIADRATYLAYFKASPRIEGADYVEGVKYVRNVTEHVLHIVQPNQHSLIGGLHGIRSYASWQEVPEAAHDALNPSTQKLKTFYDAKLVGREVMDAMMAVLRFYSEVAPSIVDRDRFGEWTGFPLTPQPAVVKAIHPEEPADLAEARVWLNGRRPGGEVRVVCGQVGVHGVHKVFGYTFVGRIAFGLFVETIEQANRDIQMGFAYLTGDVARNSRSATGQVAGVGSRPVLISQIDLASWTEPLAEIAAEPNWVTKGFDLAVWEEVIKEEDPEAFPDGVAYARRRERRLNALRPGTVG